MGERWRSGLIFRICPRSLQDMDSDGDLTGITRRRDHVASSSGDAIRLSPFLTFDATLALEAT